MITYSYSAIDAQGKETKGTVEVADQSEALQRIRNMGFFPVKITEMRPALSPAARTRRHSARLSLTSRAVNDPAARPRGRVKPAQLTVFTRQLATLLEAGMPLLRSLRLLHEQEENRNFKLILADLSASIDGGNSFSEALSQHPRVFDRLYLNMIKAGEIGGMLEVVLTRLAGFMEKAGRLRRRVRTALFYPAAVTFIATGVLALMLLVIVPRLKSALGELDPGRQLPVFSQFVFGVSDTALHSFPYVAVSGLALYVVFLLGLRTRTGRAAFDRFKLRMPIVGPVVRKLAIARFTRTLGTLITSGVPILQALTIVKEATGNVIVGRLVGRVHENVKQGESIVGPLRESNIFPAMVAGMVDVGEQTGALPEMLNKIADNYD